MDTKTHSSVRFYEDLTVCTNLKSPYQLLLIYIYLKLKNKEISS
jgi:hypothetical protein